MNPLATLAAAVGASLVLMIASPFPSDGKGAPDSPGDSGGSNGANKISVAGSEIEILGPGVAAGAGSLEETVLSTTIKTSTPADLILQVTLECALWTTVQTTGNDMAESTARVVVWVEVDGVPVPVSSDDTTDPGQVVFCDRTHRQTTTNFADENATIEQYLRTRTANAFNWVAVDVGGGSVPHLVEVKAALSGDVVGEAFSQAGIGHRTLVVEPVHLAPGYSF